MTWIFIYHWYNVARYYYIGKQGNNNPKILLFFLEEAALGFILILVIAF